MIRKFVVAATATFAIVGTSAFIAPAALALPPNCKANKVNPYVACTDKFKANTPRRSAGFDAFAKTPVIQGESTWHRGSQLRRR